jgi:glycosyltransferase involved in cell wall biosynthesis
LLTVPRKNQFQAIDKINGIDIYRIFPYIHHEKLKFRLDKLMKPFDTITNTFRMILKVRDLIKNENIDLILGFMPRFTSGFPASFSKSYGVPFILDVSDFEYYTPFWRPFRQIERQAIFKADIITVINKFIKNYIEEIGIASPRIKFIPNGVDLQLFNPNVNGTEIRHKYNNRPIILHVGAFYSLNLVIKALPLIVEKNPDVLFLFVGPPNWRYYQNQMNQTKYKKNFEFLESISHDLVAKYIAASDICIHIFSKSKYLEYAQPIKILEYFACRKPVISTDLLGVRDLFSSDLTHCLVQNYVSFAKKIIQLLADEALRKDIGKIGYNIVKSNYDWEKISEKFLKICEKLIRT